MASKNFYFQVVLRVMIITATSLGITLTFLYAENYLVFLFGLLLIPQVIWLIRYINRQNQKIAFFFDSIRNEDFTLKFSEDIPEKSFRELNKKLNQVNKQIQEVFLANRTQEIYFKEVLEQIDVGILSYNMQGHVLYANHAVKNLLSYEKLNHIRQLERLNPDLHELLFTKLPFENKLIHVSNERQTTQLSLKLSSFKLPQGQVGLLTVKDIRQELDENETESWLKLMKVLTHEIMNAITPITSITAAILDNFVVNDKIFSAKQINSDRIDNTVKGLKVIKSQGIDLMNFVQSYRSFLNVSAPKKEIVSVKDLFDSLQIIFSKELEEAELLLEVDIKPIELELFVDRQQILQVLVNLCKNALQSITHAKMHNGKFQLHAGIKDKGNKFIEIKDNGPGISPAIIDQIFVPFFTTKESGSGIGLSLSKQILRIHGGSLRAHSIPFESTSFFLIFD